MKKLLLLSTLWVVTVLLHAQGIAFEPAGTTMEQAMVKAKKEGKRIVAVGTTSTRTLESAYDNGFKECKNDTSI